MRAPVLPPPQKRKRKKRRSPVMRFLGYCFAAGVMLFLAGSAVAGFLMWKVSKDLPDYEVLRKYEPAIMTRIHAADGTLMTEFAQKRRIFIPINAVPKLVIQAYLSAEDKHFFEHSGLDFQGIARALINNYKNRGSGRRPEGASTITQQVAKNFLLSPEQNWDRKLKEAILAVRIERAFSKEEILELYLNEIFLGINSYGVAAAALNYFNKKLEELEIHEAAYLAALPKAPTKYHPYRNAKEAIARRNWVIEQLALNKYITREQADHAKQQPLGVNLRNFGVHVAGADYFAEDVRRELIEKYGEEKLYTGGLSVRTTLNLNLQKMARKALIDGLVRFDRSQGWRGALGQIEVASADGKEIWGESLGRLDGLSDIDPWRYAVVLQVTKTGVTIGLKPRRLPDGQVEPTRETAEIPFDEMKWAKTNRGAPKQPSDVLKVGDVIFAAPVEGKQGRWALMQNPEVRGAIVAMDPHTGRVLAIVGGFSFSESQFDRATQAKRQPGSSFKPFVYAAALDNGYKPTSVVLDAPITIEQKGQEDWKPKNYTEGYSGPSTLRTGIERSRNLMTVRLAQDMGMPLVVEYAQNRFGIYDNMLPVLSMSLGAGETTLLRMVTGYSMFVNGGKKVNYTFIDRIQDRYGRTVWRHDDRECKTCKIEAWHNQPEPELEDKRKQIIDPHTAYQMVSMMEGVVNRGTALVVKEVGKKLAGKTGTTNDEKDAWFIGFSPDLVAGIYIGFDTPRPMGKGNTGGQLSAPIFRDFMRMALADKKDVDFRQPPNIKRVWVDAKTGLRATPGQGAILEAFKPDEEPDDQFSVIGYTNDTDTNNSNSSIYESERSIRSGRGLN